VRNVPLPEGGLLPLSLARTRKKRIFVDPEVRVIPLGIRTGADVPQSRRFERREVGLEVLAFAGRIRPVLPAGIPERAQTLLMRNRVLDDDAAYAFGVGERQAETDRPSVVLHEQDVVRDRECCRKLVHHACEVVESIFEAGRRRRAAVAEPRIIRRDEMILVGEERQ